VGGNSLVNNSSLVGHERGLGDQYFSGQWMFLAQTESRPALALGYAIKAPIGDESRGLGSGRVDHSLTFS
jgi:hypothetical protein